MATKRDMQAAIRQYRYETGREEVDMHEVVAWATRVLGWPLPAPVSPLDRLAKEFSRAAREETRYDEKTGRPYRVNHALPSTARDGRQLTLWIDIDRAPRRSMHKSLILRREQMVGDGLQLSLDADHWNCIHPEEEPIVMDLDFTDDVEWRKNAPDDERKAG